MPKVDFRIQLDKSLWVEVQRLIDAGEYDNAAAVVEDALRAFIETFEAAAPEKESPETRTLKWMMVHLDPMQREQFHKIIESYTKLAEPPSDPETVELLTMFGTHGYRKMFWALDEIQTSQIPLSIFYLETILDKDSQTTPSTAERQKSTMSQLLVGIDNPLVGDVAKMYESEIAPLTEKVRDQIVTLVEDFPKLEQWHEAFSAAASMNKKNLAYVVGCLRGNGKSKEERQKHGTDKTSVSKSSRNRSEKQRRIRNYEDYWNEDFKASKKE
jgi:Arc/MetJ-type ribon-helix-helix transcriptional regulator